MPFKSTSLPPGQARELNHRTGAAKGRGAGKSPEQPQYGSMVQAGFPTLYPPPEVGNAEEMQLGNPTGDQNVLRRPNLEHASPLRRRSAIGFKLERTDDCAAEMVEMRLTQTEAGHSSYDCNTR